MEPFRILLCLDSFTIDGFTLGRDGGNAPPVAIGWLVSVGGIGCPLTATPFLLIIARVELLYFSAKQVGDGGGLNSH